MVLSLDRWIGKVAVVTGASSGIGAAIAEFLATKGIIVAGLARRSEVVEENAKKISGKLYAIKTDMSSEDDIINAFKWVEENLGPVHILINNAGASRETSLHNGDAKAWKSVLDVNVLGLCIATREAVKSMTTHNINGHIIHINSLLGHKVTTLPNINVYGGSKYAVTSLTETLRNEFIELGKRIKVTSLSPGLVVSEMTTQSTTYSKERMEVLKKAPILKPGDIAEAVGYVLSTPENVQINELTITPLGETL